MGKMKKILATVGLGLVIGTTTFLTGCSSDIKFNQDDLDNMIKSANTYLETQNNYSTEFAKNMLNDLMIDMYIEHYNETNIKTTGVGLTCDANGIEYKKSTFTSKLYNVQSARTTKLYLEESETTFDNTSSYKGYRELVLSGVVVYSGTDYDLNAKTKRTFSDCDYSEVPFIYLLDQNNQNARGLSGFGSPFETLDNIRVAMSGEDENSIVTNIVMDKISEDEFEFKLLMCQTGFYGNVSIQSNYILKFKNGYLVFIEASSMMFDESNTLMMTQKDNITYEYNISDFTIDVSNCIEVTE